MTKETIDKIQAEYKEMEENRVKFVDAFKKLSEAIEKVPVRDEDKKSLNSAYQAIVKNMRSIAKSFSENV